MRLFVDGELVVAAAQHASAQGEDCRALAAGLTALDGVADLDVRAGVAELTDVCADVLELVAIDLELIAARVRAGARLYSAVENSAAGANAGHGP